MENNTWFSNGISAVFQNYIFAFFAFYLYWALVNIFQDQRLRLGSSHRVFLLKELFVSSLSMYYLSKHCKHEYMILIFHFMSSSIRNDGNLVYYGPFIIKYTIKSGMLQGGLRLTGDNRSFLWQKGRFQSEIAACLAVYGLVGLGFKKNWPIPHHWEEIPLHRYMDTGDKGTL